MNSQYSFYTIQKFQNYSQSRKKLKTNILTCGYFSSPLYLQIISLELKCLNQYPYKCLSSYCYMRISKLGE